MTSDEIESDIETITEVLDLLERAKRLLRELNEMESSSEQDQADDHVAEAIDLLDSSVVRLEAQLDDAKSADEEDGDA